MCPMVGHRQLRHTRVLEGGGMATRSRGATNRVRTLLTLVWSEADSQEQRDSAYVNAFLLKR
jgi:hypothetical protein